MNLRNRCDALLNARREIERTNFQALWTTVNQSINDMELANVNRFNAQSNRIAELERKNAEYEQRDREERRRLGGNE